MFQFIFIDSVRYTTNIEMPVIITTQQTQGDEPMLCNAGPSSTTLAQYCTTLTQRLVFAGNATSVLAGGQ